MSAKYSAKLFALVSAVGLLFYIMIKNSVEVSKPSTDNSHQNIKYILDWRESFAYQYKYLDHVRSAFQKIYCPLYPNCVVTEDRELLSDIQEFDAILFHGSKLSSLSLNQLPRRRSPTQLYIFATMESANENPICDPHYDGYFNWTWTYRLDSDLLWAYILVYDLQGHVVAPRVNMNWPSYYRPISEDIQKKLMTKSKTAAWFVSHCETTSKREVFVKEVSEELKHYNMSVDIFGECSKDLQCPKDYQYCSEMIEADYYFYFSLEESFDFDYVTEKVLTAINNLAVPVVYGGANYSRFLPPGSYLDGRALGAKLLAKTMRDIIQDRSRYEDMFRWRNRFQIKEPFLIEMCNMCAKLSNAKERAAVRVWKHFRGWWNRDSELCQHWRRSDANNI